MADLQCSKLLFRASLSFLSLLFILYRSVVGNWWSQIPGKVMQGCIPVWAPIWWEKETATLQSWLSLVKLFSKLSISYFACFCGHILDKKQLNKGASWAMGAEKHGAAGCLYSIYSKEVRICQHYCLVHVFPLNSAQDHTLTIWFMYSEELFRLG